MRGLLHDEVTTFAGKHFQLTDARCEPKPVQADAADLDRRRRREAHAAHRRPVRRRLERPVRRARGRSPASAPCCTEHCDDVGRDPAEIRCAVNVGLAWTEESLREQFGGLADFVRPGVLERLGRARCSTASAQYVDAGADQVNIALRAPFDVDALERFAPRCAR